MKTTGSAASVLEGVRLGTRPDEEIAAELGLEPRTVASERSRRGIPKFRPVQRLRGESALDTKKKQRARDRANGKRR